MVTIGFETAGFPMREMSSLEATACGRPFFCQNKLHLLKAAAKPLQGQNDLGGAYPNLNIEKLKLLLRKSRIRKWVV